MTMLALFCKDNLKLSMLAGIFHCGATFCYNNIQHSTESEPALLAHVLVITQSCSILHNVCLV